MAHRIGRVNQELKTQVKRRITDQRREKHYHTPPIAISSGRFRCRQGRRRRYIRYAGLLASCLKPVWWPLRILVPDSSRMVPSSDVRSLALWISIGSLRGFSYFSLSSFFFSFLISLFLLMNKKTTSRTRHIEPPPCSNWRYAATSLFRNMRLI